MNVLPKTGRICFLLIPFTLCFWERGNTYVLFLYGFIVLAQPGLAGRFRQALRHYWLFPFLLLYAFTALSLMWSDDLSRGNFILEKKAALLVLPILLALDGQLNRKLIQAAMLSLVAGCVLSLWAALAYAAWQYMANGECAVFYYHRLGWMLDEFNAVYFSFYAFMSMVFFDCLIREKAFSSLRPGLLKGVVWGTFMLGIILLASRLFIVLTLLYGTWRLVGRRRLNAMRSDGRRRNYAWGLAFAAFSLLAVLANWGRFEELAGSRLEVLQQQEFQWDTPFNGLTLRLLLLKFGWQALHEGHSVVQGLGVGDVRQAINELVVRYNLYHGNAQLGDTGYLDYSLHNQYMENWLQAGLPALAAWLWLLAIGWKKGRAAGWAFPLLWLVMALSVLSLAESVLERQRGVVFIAFFLSILYLNTDYEATELPPAGAGAQDG